MADRSKAPAHAVEVWAPARADLAGGTLDLWPLYCFHRPAVTVNVALRTRIRLRVTRAATPDGTIRVNSPTASGVVLTDTDRLRDLIAAVSFHFVPDGGLVVEVVEQPPFGSGLGGSSVLAVALARACLRLTGQRLAPGRLVAVLRDLEAGVLGVPTGVQDYWPAITGGLAAIHLEPGGEIVERLTVRSSWLADRLLVVFTGVTHNSGMVNWDVYRARVEGDTGVREALDRIAAAAGACRDALLAHDEAKVGAAIAAEWSARRRLAPSVSSPELERVAAAGVAAGALAAKACGAGGGGSLVLWVSPSRRAAVTRAALAACPGARALPSGIAVRGAVVRDR